MVGDLLARGMGFLLLPLYTAYISEEGFGDWDTLYLAGILISLVAAHGITSAMIWAWQTGGPDGFVEPDDARRRHIVRVATGWTMIATGLVCGLGVAFAGPLAEAWTFQPDRPDLARVLVLLLLGQALRNVTYPAEGVLKLRMQSGRMATLRVTEAVVALAGNVLTVAVLRMGLEGMAWAFFAGAVVRVPLVVRAVPEMLRPTLDWSLTRPMLRYGLPFLPQATAFILLQMIDRWLLKREGLMEETGVYSYGDRFARIVEYALVTPLATMWASMMFTIAKDPDARRQFARAATLFAALAGMLAFALTHGGGALVRLFDSSTGVLNPLERLFDPTGAFAGGARVIGVLSVGYVLYGLNEVARVGFAVRGHTRRMAFCVVVAAILNVVLNLWWIPTHGAMGAAWATLVSYGTMTALSLLLTERIFPQRWEWGRLLHLAVVLVGGSIAIERLAPPDHTPAGLGVRMAAVIAAPLLLLATGFLRPEDRAALLAILSRRRSRQGDAP